jgi:methyl-accepting chemotaxis protein
MRIAAGRPAGAAGLRHPLSLWGAMSFLKLAIGRKLGFGIASILIAIAVMTATLFLILRLAGHSAESQDQLIGLARMVSAAGGVITLLLALFVSRWFFHAIIRPIAELTGVMKTLADGDVTIAVPFADRRDEIGELAKVAELLKEEAIKKQKKKAWEEESIKAWEKENEEKAAKEAEEARQDQVAISSLAAG